MREFLNKHTWNGAYIPQASTLRWVHLPHVFEQNKQQLIAELKDQQAAIIVDKYTDSLHQCVANILIELLQVSEDFPAAAKLVETVELEHVKLQLHKLL